MSPTRAEAKLAKEVKRIERDGIIQAHIANIRMALYYYDHHEKPFHTLSALVNDIGWSIDVLKAVIHHQPLPRLVRYKKNGRWHERVAKDIRLVTPMATQK